MWCESEDFPFGLGQGRENIEGPWRVILFHIWNNKQEFLDILELGGSVGEQSDTRTGIHSDTCSIYTSRVSSTPTVMFNRLIPSWLTLLPHSVFLKSLVLFEFIRNDPIYKLESTSHVKIVLGMNTDPQTTPVLRLYWGRKKTPLLTVLCHLSRFDSFSDPSSVPWYETYRPTYTFLWLRTVCVF